MNNGNSNFYKTVLFAFSAILIVGAIFFISTNKTTLTKVELKTSALKQKSKITPKAENQKTISTPSPEKSIVSCEKRASKITSEESEEGENEYEERPDMPILSGVEKKMFLEYLDSRNNTETSGMSKVSAENAGISSYVNGKISGVWQQKTTHTGWNGYRVDNSVFDSLHNVFYVVSFAGHLYKLEYQNGVKWTLLNHKIVMNPTGNDAANPIFNGTVLPDSTFRLIRSYDEQSRMEYSDDEGKTWKIASGASVTQSWANQSYEFTQNGAKRIVLHTYFNSYHFLYFSDNNGQTYSTSKLNFPISTYDVRIVKPFGTNEISLIVWNKNTKIIQMYKYSAETKDFALISNSTSTVAGTNLSSVAASYTGGKYHYYLSTINTTYTIYYSSDEGKTWVQKNAGRDRPFEVMVPNKPNMLISGFEDMKLSTDYGATWNGYGNTLGWDLQHLRTFEKSGGKFITLAGLDFGCYVSETPDVKSSYIWCNDGASFALHYDAASNEKYNSVYLGNQDRGTTAYNDSGAEVNTIDVDGTDVLRVGYSKAGKGVWSWFYYGRIRHRYNFATGNSATAVYDGLGNWWAAPLVASPNDAEDAVYVPYGANLQIFSYDELTNAITKTSHPTNFLTSFGDNLGGFGYSDVNRNYWYAALVNGTFVYSKDAGKTWTKSIWAGLKPKANDQSYNYAKNQIVIKASATDSNKVYYAGVGNYVLMSTNGGKTFALKNTGLNVYRIRDFVVTPDDKYIFAACGYNGAWIYSAADNYWYQMADSPVPTVDFTDVEFIAGKNIVRFGTFGNGILDFKVDQIFSTMAAPTALSSSIENKNYVRLNWTDNANNESGYTIERAVDGNFVCIDTVNADISTYLDTNVVYGKTATYRVRAYQSNNISYYSNLEMIDVPVKGIISNKSMKIIDLDSKETGGANIAAANAIDNNTASYWQTSWQGTLPKHPHYITFDLGSETTVQGFRYLPRQDGVTTGSIADYKMFVSNDTAQWGEPVLAGKFTAGVAWKESAMDQPVMGRYVKLVALSSLYGDNNTSAAEIAILYAGIVPLTPVNLTVLGSSSSQIVLKWTDNSVNETGFLIEQLVDGNFVKLDTVKAGYTNYSHKNLLSSTKYVYRVSAYNRFGISDPTPVLEATTKVGTGIPELKMNYKVYPNPCTSDVFVEMEALNSDAYIRLMDLNGRLIQQEKMVAGQNRLQLSVADLPKGIYFVELKTSTGKVTRKIFKE